ncbi:hypothetical protein [Rasiella sp. SM2506]|uniref:hypothetical protein n=1 Tax=Rasiella sp. SM2506 TaxID=3423914 RepID=UPI003D78EBD2
MKTETLERDMHMEALIWKSTLQRTAEQLDCMKNKLYKTKIYFDRLDTNNVWDNYTTTATHYLERIELLKNRVSKFENKLTLLNECDMNCFEEADAISILVESCSKNVKILFSKISDYTNRTISDEKFQN